MVDRRRCPFLVMAALALVVGLVVVPGSPAGASGLTGYVEMPDGTPIAVAVNFPQGAAPGDGKTYPTVFIMDGYGTGGVNPEQVAQGYVTVRASVRGTGCSGGQFGLFDRQQVEDGYYLIEQWLVEQPWSNGRVGIYGHSYAGLVGFLIAGRNPPSVDGVSVGGIFDDLYRSIVYPGGVPNRGFPVLWLGAIRPGSEAVNYSNLLTHGDTERDAANWPGCAEHIATRTYDTDQAGQRFLTNASDDAWYQERSLRTYAEGLRIPMHMIQQYQDEQTGPRGAEVLFELIPDDVPKRLRMTNGPHAATSPHGAGFAWHDTGQWFDCFLKDVCAEGVTDREQRVQLHFETTYAGNGYAFNAPYASSGWPLPETDWRRYHLRADGGMTLEPPGEDEAAVSYTSLPAGRQTVAQPLGFQTETGAATFGEGADQVRFELPFDEPTAIAGPMLASLHLSTTATDTDLFVDLLDRHPDGSLEYLQRGALRASHRAVDADRSDRIPGDGPHAGEIYRPWREHTDPQPVVPGAVERYDIEVFATGHVFRAGHSLVVQVHAPPALDPLSTWAWAGAQAAATNTVHLAAATPSTLLLPVLPELPPISEEAPACGQQAGIPCLGRH